MRIRFHWFALLWILGWSAGTLMGDFTFGTGVIAQARSYGFSEVTGRIVSSEVVRQRQSRGRSVSVDYVPQIRYEYQTGGLRYRGERVRFGQGGDARDEWARRVVRENPPGAQRPVYYDPATPAEAVLYTGFDGPTLLLALFLTPFNVVMVGGMALIWNWVRPLGPRGGARVTTLGERTKVQLTSFPPLLFALGALGLTTLVAAFPLVFVMRLDPPLAVPIGTWVLVFAVAAVAYRFARSRASRDDTDYLIDLKAGTLTFVCGLGASNAGWWNLRRKHPYTPFVVPLASICGVRVEKICPEKDAPRHLVYLIVQRKRANLGERVHGLGDWRSERDAEAFATWLRETLRLPRT